MSKGKKILNVVIYVYMAMLLWFQVMGIVAVTYGPAIFGTSLPTALRDAKWLAPTWIFTTVLVFGSFVLCKVWKKKEKNSLIPMIVSLVAIAPALIIALTLRTALPLQAALNNVSTDGAQGLTGWMLFWRHYSVVIVAVVIAIVSFLRFKSLRDERIRMENESYQEHFVLDGDPLFADDRKDAPTAGHKKLSKKQRKELREKAESGN